METTIILREGGIKPERQKTTTALNLMPEAICLKQANQNSCLFKPVNTQGLVIDAPGKQYMKLHRCVLDWIKKR